jgi:maleylacetate reductase
MKPFTYDALPGRIIFGPGTRSSVIAEVEALGLRRVMVIADANAKHVADALVDELGVMVASRWHEVAQHVPTELAEAARTAARDAQIDGIVCVGGGSTTGLAKAIALELDAPIVAVPTTYAGSEVTPIFGLTGEHKQTGRALRVLPRVVVYDPELTLDVPMSITGPSALNAIAHSVEALYGPSTNPVTTLMAGESIRAIASALVVLAREPRDLEARTQLLYGAYLAGAAFAVVGIALHHKVCHVLGGTFGLVHGEVNAVMLPHVVAFNAPGAPDAIARVAAALDVDDAACGLFDLAASVGAPTSLAQLGMPEDALGRAAERTVAETTFNPVRVEVPGVLALLDDAWHGRRPSSVVSAGATNQPEHLLPTRGATR